MSLMHAFIGLSAYLSVCVCLSLCYLFISFYYGFIPDSNKWIGLDWIGLDWIEPKTTKILAIRYGYDSMFFFCVGCVVLKAAHFI